MKKCIVVDDSKVNRKITAGILEELGFQVEQAAGAHEAIPLIAKADAEVILIDWHMPEIDGIELLEFIRESKSGKEIIAFLYSAVEDEDNVYEALQAIGEKFILKPISKEKVEREFIEAGLLPRPKSIMGGEVFKIF